MKLLIHLVSVVAICIATTAIKAKDRTMLVLDASGSMWGQIDKKPKIKIAREALKNLVADWPKDRETGLVVYGHRKKSSCTDIETVIPIGPLDVINLKKIVDNITPKGRTPLSAAVKKAAEEMKYREDKATVILISDGKETCNMDPCALGEELEKLGVDFTAHVIGFDVMKTEDQRGLRCLAENTGGDFIPASDAKELNDALLKTAQAPEPEPEKEEELPEVTLVSPESVIQGADFNITIQAPAETDGRVYLYRKGKDKAITYQRIQEGKTEDFKPVLLRAPAKTGDYVLKFLTLKNRVVTENPLQVTEAEFSLTAPDEVIKSAEFKVMINAPEGIQGRVYLYREGKKKPVTYQRVVEGKNDDYQAVKLRVPAQLGDYVLKFLTLRNEVLAEKPITVVDAEITLQAPASATKSTDINITLKAPPGIDGRVYIYRKGKEKAITYQRIQKDSIDDYKPVKLRMPATPGDYVLKFLSLRNEVLAEAEIQVEDVEIALHAPDSAPIATHIQVILKAPPGLDGRIYLFAEGKDKFIEYKRLQKGSIENYKPAKLSLPAKPGKYVIKFLSLRKEPLAETTIGVTAAEVSLKAPTEAIKESPIEVTPIGPPGMEGRIHLFAAGKDKSITYQRIREGAIEDYDPVKIKLPKIPGDYILKFFSLRKELLAEANIKVTESEP